MIIEKVVKIDGGLGRVIAMTGAITELAKKIPTHVITSRPIVFWGNTYIKSLHNTDEEDLYQNVIKGREYIELEPYTDYRLYNNKENWLDVASYQLGLKVVSDPCLFLAEHEKYKNILEGKTQSSNVVLFQPFGSTMDKFGCDKTYRSFKVEDAQYIADELNKRGYTIYQIYDKEKQPTLKGCVECSNPNLRWIISLADRYPVIGCDSCMQHAAKGFGKQAVVMWGGTDMERFGYKTHINLWENGMVEHIPMRFGKTSFNTHIVNQYSNKFSKKFLDNFIDTSENLLQSRYK